MEAIIFDLDGTMWDATYCSADIFNTMFQKHGIQKHVTQKDIANLMGKTMEEIAAILFPEMEREKHNAIINTFGQEECIYLKEHGGMLYPDLEKTLQILKEKYKLLIVSNCQDGYIEAFLHAHNLQKYFEDYEMEGRTGFSKGKNIQLVMERNHIKDAVYVGDTLGDEKVTREAGLPFIFASYGFGECINPDATLSSFSDLIHIMNIFNK